jgi:hypothetical protein
MDEFSKSEVLDNIPTPWASAEEDQKEMDALLQKRAGLLQELEKVEAEITALAQLISIANS